MGFEAEIDNSERSDVVENLRAEVIWSICCSILLLFLLRESRNEVKSLEKKVKTLEEKLKKEEDKNRIGNQGGIFQGCDSRTKRRIGEDQKGVGYKWRSWTQIWKR
jgi:thymidylate synthase